MKITQLPREISETIMRELSLADKAAVASTCRTLRQWWKDFPYSSEDYGSSVPHRSLGPSPSAMDWLAVTRERIIAGHGGLQDSDLYERSIYDNAVPLPSLANDQETWVRRYSSIRPGDMEKPYRGDHRCTKDTRACTMLLGAKNDSTLGDGPLSFRGRRNSEARKGLMLAARLGICHRRVLEKPRSHSNPLDSTKVLKAFRYLLWLQNREKDTLFFVDKLAEGAKMSEAIASGDLPQIQELIAKGVPLPLDALANKMHFVHRPELRSLALGHLTGSARQFAAEYFWQSLMWKVSGHNLRTLQRTEELPMSGHEWQAAVDLFGSFEQPQHSWEQCKLSPLSTMLWQFLNTTNDSRAEMLADAFARHPGLNENRARLLESAPTLEMKNSVRSSSGEVKSRVLSRLRMLHHQNLI